jgi:hypothetical protein
MLRLRVMPAKAGIQNLIIDESIWIPASAGITKDAIHPRFEKRGILAYLRKGYDKSPDAACLP